MTWSLEYLKKHPVHHQNAYEEFLGGVIDSIKYSQVLTESGLTTGTILDPITVDLEQVKGDLNKGVSADERMIADYINVALQEVYFARYLEESAAKSHHGPSYEKPAYDFMHQDKSSELTAQDLVVPLFHERDVAVETHV